MYIWSQLRFPREFPSVLALSSMILLFSFLLVFLALWIGRLGAVDARSAGGRAAMTAPPP
jgi:spermidine/putrescine transport system permease protein